MLALYNATLPMTGMMNPRIEKDLTISGEVVETFERNGVRIAKVSFTSLHIELPMETLEAAHLGDKVIVTARLVLQSVDMDFGSTNHK